MKAALTAGKGRPIFSKRLGKDMDLNMAVKIITPGQQDQKARRCEKFKMVGPKRLRKTGSSRKMSKDRTVLMKGTSIEKELTWLILLFTYILLFATGFLESFDQREFVFSIWLQLC